MGGVHVCKEQPVDLVERADVDCVWKVATVVLVGIAAVDNDQPRVKVAVRAGQDAGQRRGRDPLDGVVGAVKAGHAVGHANVAGDQV